MDAAPHEVEAELLRKRRRWLWVALAAFVVVAGIAAWRHRAEIGRAQEARRDLLARHRARLHQELVELAALPRGRGPLVEPAVAGDAAAVVEAFLDAVEAVPEDARDRLDSDGDPAASEEIDDLLRAHPEPIRRLEPLLSVPSAPPPPRVDWLEGSTKLWRSGAGRLWLSVAADRALARGDPSHARTVALLELALGAELARDGVMVGDLAGSVAAKGGARHLLAALARAPWTSQEARRVGIALARLQAYCPSPLEILTVVTVELRSLLLEPHRSPEGTAAEGERDAALEGLDATSAALRAGLSGWDSNAPASIARLRAVADRAESAILREVTSVHPAWLRGRAETLAWLRVARTAVAVEEARAVRGALPASLGELVPEFLESVPIDPWDGRPLRYREGVVWSVGRNETDDGGTSPEDPDDSGAGDYVGRVAPR